MVKVMLDAKSDTEVKVMAVRGYNIIVTDGTATIWCVLIFYSTKYLYVYSVCSF